MAEVLHSGGDPVVTMRHFLELFGDDGLAGLLDTLSEVMSARTAAS
jgi:hypothetical protein